MRKTSLKWTVKWDGGGTSTNVPYQAAIADAERDMADVLEIWIAHFVPEEN